MNRRFLIAGITAGALAGAAACSDGTAPTGLTSSPSASFQVQATADLAPSAGEDAASDYEFLTAANASGSGVASSFSVGTTTVGGLVHPSVNAPVRSAGGWISPLCTFDVASGRFLCPPVSRRNHTYTVSYALFDASGVAQQSYDKVTTASINFIVQDTGAVSFSNNGNTFADTSSRYRNATVSGLAGDPDTVRTWNGYGSGSVKSVRTGQISKIYELASTDTVDGVRFKQPRDINPYPLSGSIVRNYAVTRTRQASDTTQRSTSRRVVVTFNGTANVPMTITGPDGSTASFTLNLDTHEVTKN